MNTMSVDSIERMEIREITIRAQDGYALHGTHYAPDSAKAAILLNAGTAIPQYFYQAFAMYLANRGYAVLTYDYRGVGMSRPEKLSTLYNVTKQDWATLDMSAGLARLRREHPELPLMLFGHSLGGQLMGLMHGIEHVDAIATYGCGFGYWGAMPAPHKYKVFALWYLFVPVLSRAVGYFPASVMGLGEDIPSGAAMEWARWGRRKHYFTSELAQRPGFQDLDVPWFAVQAIDDDITTKVNADGLFKCYPNAKMENRTIEPGEFEYDSLGHLSFFSRKKRRAWDVFGDWFDQQTKIARSKRLQIK